MDLADRLEGGIHRAVAFGGGRDVLAVDFHLNRGFRRAAGAAGDFHRHQLQRVIVAAFADAHQRNDIVVKDFFFAVGQFFEAHKEIFQLVVANLVAQLRELVAQRRTARVFAQRQRGARQTHIFGAHDFKGFFVLQHAILVDADSCAKAFLPTMALFGCTTKPDTVETRREICMIFCVSMPVW